MTSGTALTGVVAGSTPADSGAEPALSGVSPGATENSSNGTRSGKDTTIDVVITFVNDTAQQNVSFGANVTVTGGEDIEVAPVLFAAVDESALSAIRTTPGVESVGVDQQVQLRRPSPDSGEGIQATNDNTTGQTAHWGIQHIGGQEISDRVRSAGTRNVTVAVLDSGIDYDHPELGNSVVWGANFTYGSERYGIQTADDGNGHGTSVAGIIAAGDNGQGVASGTRLYAVKTLNRDNVGKISWLIEGIDAAVAGPDGVVGTDDDADVIHMSIGTMVDDDELAAVVTAASEHTILVGAAGNAGDGNPETDEVTYPGAYPEVLAVAATDRNRETADFSSEGPAVEIAAPGSSVTTLASGGGTVKFSGTSAAAPYVSGTVALMLAADRTVNTENRTHAELRALLRNTSQDIGEPGPDRSSGNGLLRADRAVAAILEESGTRVVTDQNLSNGDTTTVTVTARAAGDYVSVSESFAPSFASAEIDTVRVNGKATTTSFRAANRDGATVTVDGLDIGDRVEITYTIQTPADDPANEIYGITGEVINNGTETDLETAELTVQSGSTDSIVATYDADNDSDIDIGELGQAAVDYSSGDISVTELSDVAAAYTGS